MGRRVRGALVAGAVLASAGVPSCQAPTEVTVTIAVDFQCKDLKGVNVTVGALGDFEDKPPVVVTSACDAAGAVGSVVLVPSDAKDGQIAFKIVAGFGQSVEQCVPPYADHGCIVARRSLRYLAHTPLLVPVTMSASCSGIPCGLTDTCVNGACVTATVVDPGTCVPPLGCALGASNDAGAPVEAGVPPARDSGGPAVCGDGIRQAGEQCDDGNLTDLDGCDETCAFEQVHRANNITMQFTTGALCTRNALGGAFGSVSQGIVAQLGTSAVAGGGTTSMLAFTDLTDLSGQNQPNVRIGTFGGAPFAAPAGVTYNGASDLDWWYAINPVDIFTSRHVKSFLVGKLAGGVLDATGTMEMMFLMSGTSPTHFHLSTVIFHAVSGAVSAPLASTGATPGHLGAEQLDPALKSFGAMTGGVLCGNISAESLAAVPLPSQLATGPTACSEGYGASATILDALVGGCTVLTLSAINKTQPDASDPAIAALGAGAPYTLVATNLRVSGCTDRLGAAAPLAACLSAAAYSSYFTHTSDRVIAK